eukprot:TRINITY_DN47897_c0_g1_i1.p1 TRINITY_DN47897_c0_g1~~TRINITY_DN47897_c0_g1_i1.p1  ORF type:complete len:148 (-),score=26.87 TRINITY_DN47897_c0_g1_i1:300-743(-)
MYRLLGVDRKDRVGKLRHLAENWAFFDAPVGIILTTPRTMGSAQWADLGSFLGTLGLLAREAGLHTCFQEAWASWPQAIASELKLPKSEIVFCGVALGYADKQAPVNSLRSERASLGEVATFHGFDDDETSSPSTVDSKVQPVKSKL